MADKIQFDRELYRKVFERFGSWSLEDIEHKLDIMEHDHRNLKSGPNVLRVDYYEHLLPESEILELENVLGAHNLELSYFDRSRSPQASVIEYFYQLYVSTSIQDEIIKNIVWDAIAGTIILVLGSIKRLFAAPKKNGVISITFDMPTSVSDKVRKLTINIPGDVDAKLVKSLMSHLPGMIKEYKDDTRRAKQISRFIEDTLTLQTDGTLEISTFESPEYREVQPTKRKASKRKKPKAKVKKKPTSKKR